MTPTDEFAVELRELLDEEIPQDGTDADTGFTDERIDALLERAVNIHAAAAEGWRRKAARIQRRLTDIASYQVGGERYDRVNLQTALSAALEVAKTFDEQAAAAAGGGSRVLEYSLPEVV